MSRYQAIGILGGMGPEASGYLYKLLIELAISEFQAKHNDEFPEIFLASVPVPDFISDETQKKQALAMLQNRVKQMQQLELSCFSIACNTAHLLLPELQEMSMIPFISMISEVGRTVQEKGLHRVGILGTPTTIKSNLYQTNLETYGISSMSPDLETLPLLERAIRNVIAGNSDTEDEENLRRIADSLKEKGVEGIVLGCTELPLVFPQDYSLPVFNSVEILARALLRKYYKNTTIGAI